MDNRHQLLSGVCGRLRLGLVGKCTASCVLQVSASPAARDRGWPPIEAGAAHLLQQKTAVCGQQQICIPRPGPATPGEGQQSARHRGRSILLAAACITHFALSATAGLNSPSGIKRTCRPCKKLLLCRSTHGSVLSTKCGVDIHGSWNREFISDRQFCRHRELLESEGSAPNPHQRSGTLNRNVSWSKTEFRGCTSEKCILQN